MEDMRLICDDFKVGPKIGFGGPHMSLRNQIDKFYADHKLTRHL